jgi:hypothetical protein
MEDQAPIYAPLITYGRLRGRDDLPDGSWRWSLRRRGQLMAWQCHCGAGAPIDGSSPIREEKARQSRNNARNARLCTTKPGQVQSREIIYFDRQIIPEISHKLLEFVS